MEGVHIVKAPQIPKWLTRIVGFSGGAGLFVVSFLDSSVLSFPFITDLLYMEFVIQRPVRMPYYALMATAGSLSGCIWLYILSKKGGSAYRRRRGSKQPGRIQNLVQRHAFLSVILPAILPPPMPFKAFVIAEGVAEVPLRTFIIGVLAGRGLRYALEGILAMKYGHAVENVMLQNKTLSIVVPLVLFGAIYALTRWLLKPAKKHG